MTKIEIINETVEYYRTHPRGINPDEQCVYLSLESAKCAVGRCMNEERLKEYGNFIGSIGSLVNEEAQPVDYFLQEKYHGHPLKFWENLQALHDGRSYWEETEEDNILTNVGLNYLAELKAKYAEVVLEPAV